MLSNAKRKQNFIPSRKSLEASLALKHVLGVKEASWTIKISLVLYLCGAQWNDPQLSPIFPALGFLSATHIPALQRQISFSHVYCSSQGRGRSSTTGGQEGYCALKGQSPSNASCPPEASVVKPQRRTRRICSNADGVFARYGKGVNKNKAGFLIWVFFSM